MDEHVEGRPEPAGWLRPAPVLLGATVAGLLVALGIGAAVLPEPVGGTPVAASPATMPDSAAPPPTTAAPAAAESSAPPAPASSISASPARATPKPRSTPEPKPKPARTNAPGTIAALEDAVVRLTNQERAKAGCGPLRVEPKLRTAARLHVQDLVRTKTFSHLGSDGRDWQQRADAQGYRGTVSENLAGGQSTAEHAMEGWMASRGHRENMLNCRWTSIGVGVAAGESTVWAQLFGDP